MGDFVFVHIYLYTGEEEQYVNVSLVVDTHCIKLASLRHSSD